MILNKDKMMKVISIFLWILIPAAVFTSCQQMSGNRGKHVIAECYGNYLYSTDLENVVLQGISAEDSIELTKQYINSWIMQQIMLQQAERNLTEEQKDVDAQLESYRNSLIIYAYESELIRQKLDTIVTPEQIEYFYNENKQDFLLHENIVRVNYLKIPSSSAKNELVNRATRLLRSNTEEDLEKLIELCDKSMLICYTEAENWIRFDDLIKEVPIDTEDQDNFLSGRSFYEFADSNFVYLVSFKEIRNKESVSPLQMEASNNKNIILNTRKIELINKMQQSVFQEALAKKEFTIF